MSKPVQALSHPYSGPNRAISSCSIKSNPSTELNQQIQPGQTQTIETELRAASESGDSTRVKELLKRAADSGIDLNDDFLKILQTTAASEGRQQTAFEIEKFRNTTSSSSPPPASSALPQDKLVKVVVMGDSQCTLLHDLLPKRDTDPVFKAMSPQCPPRAATVVQSRISLGEASAPCVFFSLTHGMVNSTLNQEILAASGHCVFLAELSLTKSNDQRSHSVWDFLRVAKSQLHDTERRCRPAFIICATGIDQVNRAAANTWARKIFRTSSAKFPEFDIRPVQLVSVNNPSTLDRLRSVLLQAHEKALLWSPERSDLHMQTLARVQANNGTKVVTRFSDVAAELANAIKEPRDSAEVQRQTKHMLRILHSIGRAFWFEDHTVLRKWIFIDPHWVCSELISAVGGFLTPTHTCMYRAPRWTDAKVRERFGDVGLDQTLFHHLLEHLCVGYLPVNHPNDFVVLPQPQPSSPHFPAGKAAVVKQFLAERRQVAPHFAVLGHLVGLQDHTVHMLPSGLFQLLQVRMARSELFPTQEAQFLVDCVVGRYRVPQSPGRDVFCAIYLDPRAHAIGIWMIEPDPTDLHSGYLIKQAMQEVLGFVSGVFAKQCKGAVRCVWALSVRQLAAFDEDDFKCKCIYEYPTHSQGDVQVSPTYPCPVPDVKESRKVLLGERFNRKVSLFVGSNPNTIHKLIPNMVAEMNCILQSRSQGCVQTMQNPSCDQALARLEQIKAAVFHFAGHGLESGIGFTSSSGELELADTDSLVSRLALMAKPHTSHKVLECVVLNCCHGKRLGRALHAAGLPNVVCWESGALSTVCLLFAEAFHKSLERSMCSTAELSRFEYREAFFAGIRAIQKVKAVAFKEDQQRNHSSAMEVFEREVFQRVLQVRSSKAVDKSVSLGGIVQDVISEFPLDSENRYRQFFDMLRAAVLADHISSTEGDVGKLAHVSVDGVNAEAATRFQSATKKEVSQQSQKLGLPHCSIVFNMVFLACWHKASPDLDILTPEPIRKAIATVESLFGGIQTVAPGEMTDKSPPNHMEKGPRMQYVQYVFLDRNSPEVDGLGRKAVRDPEGGVFLVNSTPSGRLFQEYYQYLHPLIQLRDSGDPPDGSWKGYYGWLGNTRLLAGRIACGVPMLITKDRGEERQASPGLSLKSRSLGFLPRF